jgi:hypothetical protein
MIGEVITGMMACTTRINHLGIDYIPRRSTLAEANANRPETVFGDLCHRLYAHFLSGQPFADKTGEEAFYF